MYLGRRSLRLHALRVSNLLEACSLVEPNIFIYRLHHTRLPAYVRDMKKYHLAHHYKNFDLGFGVTSKIWDYVFNTVLPV